MLEASPAPRGGVQASRRVVVPAASLALEGDIQFRRNGIQIEVANLQTAEQVALDLRSLPIRFLDDAVPMADRLFPGISLAVQLPDHASFGAERSNHIEDALRAVPPDDFKAFRRGALERLLAEGVSANAPHTQTDVVALERLRAQGLSPDAPDTRAAVPMFSPERRVWLQAEGSATGGYHHGGIRSPAATSSGVGSGLGVLLSGMRILVSPHAYPDAARDLTVAAVAGATGG